MLTRVPPAWEFECCATVFLQWLRKDKQTNFSLPRCALLYVSILVFGRFPGKSLTFKMYIYVDLFIFLSS